MVRPGARHVPVPATRGTRQRVETVLLLHTVRARAETLQAAKKISVFDRSGVRQLMSHATKQG